MTGDATTPIHPMEQKPRALAGALRLLEMFLFALVFIAGGLLSWVATFGESDAQVSSRSGLPIPVPALTPLIPAITPLIPAITPLIPDLPEFEPVPIEPAPGFGDQVQFSNARGDARPPAGCSAHIDYVWEIDRGLSPPISGRALIEVNGPGVGGDYRRPVQGGEIRLSLDVTLSSHDVFTADVISVGSVPAFPTPLEVSYDTPFC